MGLDKAELVLKNADYINVFTESVEHADIAINNGVIIGIGEYKGIEELDCSGKTVAPGFIDGHIHLESSMLRPAEFAKTVISHGTSAVITDPHEIANVCGIDGIQFMMEASAGLPIDVYFTLPSCVPATSFDENGCTLTSQELEPFYENERVLGLAEVMDYFAAIQGNLEIQRKIEGAMSHNKVVDGHAPGIHGKEVNTYVLAGVGSDHECINLEEGLEKLRLGQWIMIREGTAAKNLEALMGLFCPPYHQRAMLVTDDKHPYDLLKYGHMDDIIRKAVKMGADPCIAVKMATLNTANYFKLKSIGAIAPGYKADLVILEDGINFHVEKLIKNGKIIYREKEILELEEPAVSKVIQDKVYDSIHVRELKPEDFMLAESDMDEGAKEFRAIRFIKDEIVTGEIRRPVKNGEPIASVEEDILKLVCIERHHDTGHIGIAYANGFGLKKGAIASSVSHDSHNIIAIGTNDTDLAAAANCIRRMQGGWAIALEGIVIASLPLPIAGLISELDAVTLSKKIEEMKQIAREFGVPEGIDPFMTLAFVSLPVIPELRLIPAGLFDAVKQKLVPILIKTELHS